MYRSRACVNAVFRLRRLASKALSRALVRRDRERSPDRHCRAALYDRRCREKIAGFAGHAPTAKPKTAITIALDNPGLLIPTSPVKAWFRDNRSWLHYAALHRELGGRAAPATGGSRTRRCGRARRSVIWRARYMNFPLLDSTSTWFHSISILVLIHFV